MKAIETIAYRAKRKPGEPPRPCSGLPAPVAKPATNLSALPPLLEPEVAGPHLVHELENPAAAAGDASQWIVRHDDGQARFLRQELVDVTQQGAAAGEHDAALRDVRAELRRGLLERLLDGAHDVLQRLLQRLEDLVAVQGEAARHALGEIASLDRELAHLLAGVGGADLDLDALRGGLADEDAVVAAHVVHDRLVEAIAADARGVGVYDAVQRQHCDLGRAATDVEHHGAARLVHRQTRADRCGHRLTHAGDVARASALGRLADGAPLHLGGAEGYAHQHARRGLQHPVAVHLINEELEHLLRIGEVGDHAVLHRPHRGDVARSAAKHAFGLGTDGDDDLAAAGGLVLYRHDRRLVEDDALVADRDQSVGRPQIDRQIAGEIAAQAFEHEASEERRLRGTPRKWRVI